MNDLRVRLFGRFSVELDGQILEGLEASKVQELFSYLLIHRDRTHPRETLAGILWEANSTTKSKKYLRQALWQLQNAFKDFDDSDQEPIMIIEAEWIRINPKAKFHLDIEELESAFKASKGLRGRELDADQIGSLKSAVQDYAGDLLLGWYQDWCLFERERLQNMLIAMLDKLMGYCEAQGEYEDGILYGMEILGFDRARERTHRRLMRLYYLAGDRTSALRQFQRCAGALEEELGVKPAKKTEELYTFVVEDRPIANYLVEGETQRLGGSISESTIDLPLATTHLKRLQKMLTEVQQSVHQDLETIENVLKTDP